jgi:regulatory protein
MRRAPRKLQGEEELYAAALRALMRRAHSVYEMRLALERRAEEKALVRRVLDRLKRENLLDDARYARQFARYHVETRRRGRFRIARDLRARGVPDRHIEAALAEIFEEVDEAMLLRKRLERRLRTLRGAPGRRGGLDPRKLASLYRSLLRAGFSADTIRRELRALTKVDPGEIELPVEEGS